MGKINGWTRKEKSTKGHASPSWKKGTDHIWVYQHQNWEISPDTGNIKKRWITHYTVQKYNENSGKGAHSIGSKKFKTKASATKFALGYIRRN